MLFLRVESHMSLWLSQLLQPASSVCFVDNSQRKCSSALFFLFQCALQTFSHLYILVSANYCLLRVEKNLSQWNPNLFDDLDCGLGQIVVRIGYRVMGVGAFHHRQGQFLVNYMHGTKLTTEMISSLRAILKHY